MQQTIYHTLSCKNMIPINNGIFYNLNDRFWLFPAIYSNVPSILNRHPGQKLSQKNN